ncbi:MAG: hypothetical protein RSE57_06280 [Clostridia bacterium]
MNCKYIARRTSKHKAYCYCRYSNSEITLLDCNSCLNKEYKSHKQLRNKTKKQAVLENSRYSILTNNFDECYCCGRKKEHTHEIYKGRNRKTSMKYGFCIPICDICHERTENDITFLRELQVKCQKKYEESHIREEFMQIIGKNYL